jgi:hypothetical protein
MRPKLCDGFHRHHSGAPIVQQRGTLQRFRILAVGNDQGLFDVRANASSLVFFLQ